MRAPFAGCAPRLARLAPLFLAGCATAGAPAPEAMPSPPSASCASDAACGSGALCLDGRCRAVTGLVFEVSLDDDLPAATVGLVKRAVASLAP
jgi:hypothetical protein